LTKLNIRQPWATTSAQPKLKPSFFHSYCLKTGFEVSQLQWSGFICIQKENPQKMTSNPAHESAELDLFSRNPKAKRNVEPYCLPYFQVYGWMVYVDSLKKKLCKIVLIECCIEDQASSPSYDDLAPPPSLPHSSISKLSLFLSLTKCRRASLLTGEGEGWGGGRGKIIRRRESLVPFKSFHTL
jgi:hypothetical protein